MKKLYISVSEIESMVDDLANQILKSNLTFDNIVGIANSGLNVSLPLAKKLKCPHSSIRISRYQNSKIRAKPIIQGKLPFPTGNLIVDDLVDDGGTMELFDEHFGLSGNKTAVLYWKTGSFKPDFYVKKKPNSWICFPWD